MYKTMFETKVFKLFEALFKNQGVWLNSRMLGAMTGTKINSVSVLMKRTVAFLDEEGLLKVKQDPEQGRVYMFIGQCEKPEEEARIWFGKMQEGRKKYTRAVPIAVTPAPQPAIAISNIQVDQNTMEAILRVPLDKLAAVLRAVGNPTS
jgi:hypothetical protein